MLDRYSIERYTANILIKDLMIMEFKKYYDSLSPQQKKELAQRLDTSTAYLSQVSTGYRRAGNKFLDGIYKASNGNVSVREFFPPEVA